ncbi:MAG: flagellar filament capping protein FliD, partial [Firmicutes bacterium]|nr:flagellar filament capping protein FliD [Bacillota bacterium]
GESKEIEINPEGDTNEERLNAIARQINQAQAGVTASVVKLAAGEYKLYLTSKETGTVNQISLADVGGDRVLKDLGVLTEDDEIAHEAQAATDSVIEINGDTANPARRSGNQITDLIPGINITLKEEGIVTLGVELDKDKIVQNVKAFVDAYNAVIDYINQHKSFSYDAATKTGSKGALFGDSALLNIESKLKEFLYQTVDGVPQSVGLLSLVGIKGASGIEGAKSGRLEFDQELFKTKLESNLDDIARLFGATSDGTQGIFTRMHDALFEWTGSSGILKTKTDTLQKQMSDIDKQVAAMEDRLAKREEYYYAKFMAMEKALAAVQSQSAWLSAQLTAISSNWKK